MQIYQLQMHQLVCHSHVNNTFTNTLTLITNQPFITAPAWWGGRMKADRNEAPWCWDDDDSDYDMTDWVDYKEDAWLKIATLEVFDYGYDNFFKKGRWRACELLKWKYEGNLSLEYEPGVHLCVKFSESEIEGLPPETYSLCACSNEDKHMLENSFGDKMKVRNLKYF